MLLESTRDGAWQDPGSRSQKVQRIVGPSRRTRTHGLSFVVVLDGHGLRVSGVCGLLAARSRRDEIAEPS